MKTTLFSSEKLSHWKAAILEKGFTLEIKLGPLFQVLVLEAKDPVMILDHFYTLHQMYVPQIFVFQNKLRTYTLW